MTIGERIKQRRKDLDMSVDQLADILGKNRATVYRYENDEIENLPTTILEPLANALRTTPASLMGWNDAAQDSKQSYSQKYDCEINKLTKKEFDLLMELTSHFHMLNSEGMEESVKRIKELTYIPLYCKEKEGE
ncbi:helix-turn-helix domain-containing protein [Anaerosacchariphilus polymeriproducens]|uniref:XRE family transcriptional regulator n=1 Tax=Anaerosacchariphilus polymeriproducens TaxID=1812858 RepID=A0A371ARS8_9FIRM|nr:helix-turn-helix transcriptional regulator [Anaerosacchariphilus polymeriproducens]RDU22180.1 XRE family transcriptional regulator [Anaerosacchariphilus polymeriproducens]